MTAFRPWVDRLLPLTFVAVGLLAFAVRAWVKRGRPTDLCANDRCNHPRSAHKKRDGRSMGICQEGICACAWFRDPRRWR